MLGSTIGSYLIENKIGEGGMGVVYAAKHTRMHGRAVIKVLHDRFARDSTIAKRFENEAKAAASIGHPGIVKIFDVGSSEQGLFIVMELLEGESLQQRLNREKRLSVEQTLSIVRQAVGALGAAHAAGIVHRDLKPDNIFLTVDPEVEGGERVKLLDFGIAKLAGDDAKSMVTGTGAMMGTPHFMSPEQCRGAGEVDARTDLYAIGCILFLLLTGRTPFQGKGVGDYIAAHLTQEPPLIRSLLPSAPEYLEELVSVLLAKDPAERFHSADALLAALKGYGDSLSGTTQDMEVALAETLHTPAPLEEAAASSTTLGASAGQSIDERPPLDFARRRKRSPLLIIAPLLMAAAASAFLVLRSAGEGEGETSALPAPAKPESAKLQPPVLALEAMNRYRSPQGSEVSEFNSGAWWETVAADFRVAAGQEGAPVRWSAGEQVALGFIALLKGEQEQALVHYRKAVELDPEWALAHEALSIGLSRMSQFDEALVAAQSAQRLDPEWVGGIAAAARVLVAQNKLDEGIKEYRRALRSDAKNANLMAELALLYHAVHLDPSAQRFGQMALEADPELVSVRIMLAERALEKGDAKAALAESSRALATAPRSLSAQLAYADALSLNKMKREARAAYEKAVELDGEKGRTSSEHDARMKLVVRALGRGRLPLRRGEKRSRPVRSRDSSSEKPGDGPVRSRYCGPNDPLCGF